MHPQWAVPQQHPRWQRRGRGTPQKPRSGRRPFGRPYGEALWKVHIRMYLIYSLKRGPGGPDFRPEGPGRPFQTFFGEAEGRLGGLFGPPGPPRPPKSAFSKIPLNLIIKKHIFWSPKGVPPLCCQKTQESLRTCIRKALDFEGPSFLCF